MESATGIPRRRWAWLWISLLIAGLGGIGGYWSWVRYSLSPERWPALEFSPREWRALSEEKRFVFVKDLTRSGELGGLTQEEVVELLGPPAFAAPEGEYLTYVVKHADPDEPGFNSVYLLHIGLSSSGIVEEVSVRAD